jgi:hypothetical protein
MQIKLERAGFMSDTVLIEITDYIKGVKCRHVHEVEIINSVDIIRLIDDGIFEAQKALEESIKRKLTEF